jgi:peptidoglycan/LPS O-acetylase OafA/YrhL
MSAASERAAAESIRGEPGPALGYVPALDGLRGIAVLMVMAFHANLSWTRGGFLGVDVFFVLSGFLISRLLLEERARSGAISFGRFYLRRALRLFPALAVLLAVHVAAALLWLEEPRRGWVLSDVWTCASYQINWWRAFAPRPGLALSPLDHTWSLAAEEQFYLVWPLGLAALARLGGARAVAIGAALGAFASALWSIRLWDPADFHRAYFGLDAHAHGLLIGAAFAAAALGRTPRRSSGALRAVGPLALLAIVACTVLARLNQPALQLGGYVAFALATVLVLRDVLAGGVLARALAWAPLVWIGRVSYALYLWHAPLLWALRVGAPSLDEHTRLALYLLGSLALAALSYRFVELPFLGLKHRFAAAPSSVRAPAGL